MIEEIESLIHEAAADAGYLVYSQAVVLRGENSRIIVKIDNLEGISHDDCKRYSKALDDKLSAASLLPNFALEISSPGLDRELKTREDYIRFVNSPVKVKHKAEKGTIVTQGNLESVDDNSLTIRSEKKQVTVAFDLIEQVNLDY